MFSLTSGEILDFNKAFFVEFCCNIMNVIKVVSGTLFRITSPKMFVSYHIVSFRSCLIQIQDCAYNMRDDEDPDSRKIRKSKCIGTYHWIEKV